VTGTTPPPIAALAPTDLILTEYDRAHVTAYLRLLDAAAASAPWQEVAQIVLGLETSVDPQGAHSTYASHLARAQWLVANGFRELLKPS
jgi:hypothetical protein